MSWCGRILRRTAAYVLWGSVLLSVLPSGVAADLAIVIGANMNRDTRDKDLTYAVADAELIQQTLIEGGFPEQQIRVLSDNPKDGSLFPELEHIRRELRENLPLMKKEDRLILFFAGHGLITGGEWVFVPYDFNRDNALGTSFRFSELRDLLKECPAERKLLLLDCCRVPMSASGSAAGAPVVVEPEEKLPLSDVFRGSGAAVIAACRAGMRSYEFKDLQHGVFASGLAEALRGQADGVGGSQDGVVDTLELSGWLPTRVRELARAYDHQQEPVVSEEFPTFALTKPGILSVGTAGEEAVSGAAGSEPGQPEEPAGLYVAMRWLFLGAVPLILVWFLWGQGRRPPTVRNVGRDRQVVD